MTILAYRDRVFAADTGVNSEGILIGRVQKITRLKKGRLLGVCGEMAAVGGLVRLMEAQDAPSRQQLIDCGDDCSALLVLPDETVIYIDTDKGSFFEIEAPYHAMGKGDVVALVAMRLGKTAQEAAQLACDMVPGDCIGPIQVEELEEFPKKRKSVSEKIG